jgi:hypothetical protein
MTTKFSLCFDSDLIKKDYLTLIFYSITRYHELKPPSKVCVVR